MHHLSYSYVEELSSESPKVLKKKLEFANSEQLLEWYQREDGEKILVRCSKSKSFKRAWKEYAMEYNKKKATHYWYVLPTTTEWVINKFWYDRDNEIFFRLVFCKSKEELDILSTEDISVTPEKLRAWYMGEGKAIVEACKASPDFAEAWKERITEHNAIFAVKNLFFIPTTIIGIILVFGVQVASVHNVIALLAGEDMSKIDLVRKNSPYMTAEEIRHWYENAWGREVIHNCQVSGNFAVAWRAYADEYNKKVDFKWGAQMPNNKVGLVTRLGGSSYTIPVIVRLLENLPEQSSEMEEMLEKIQESLLITERFHEIGRERKEILKQQRLERKKQEQQEKEKKNAAEAAAKEERKKKRMDETAARKEVKRLEKLQNPKKIGRPRKNETSATVRRNTRKRTYAAVDNCIPPEEQKWINTPPKSPIVIKEDANRNVTKIIEEKSLNTVEMELLSRFPYIFRTNSIFYTAIFQFIKRLEITCPVGEKITDTYLRFETVWTKLFFIIRQEYLRHYPESVIEYAFDEMISTYDTMMKRNEKIYPLDISMSVHMD